MTNEELMAFYAEGDRSALDTLCEQNRGLIHDRAERIAFLYHCYRFNDRGNPTAYTIELLSDLEGEGMAAFIECICGGRYIPSKGMLTTYAVPFIDGAMRRYLESSMGTLAIDRGSMTLVRKAQELYHVQRMTVDEIASELDIPLWLAAKHIKYATHFLSVYDLARHDDDDDDRGDYGDDVYDYLAEQTMFEPPDTALHKKYRHEYLHRLFQMLPKKEQDILGKCYGMFGYAREPLDEIAMYHFMKTDAVEKARTRALGKLQKLMREYPNPYALAEAAVRRAVREYNADEECSTPQCAWYEADQK
jgi:RNA polymerase sigma factor (sigma-70 family)